LIYIKAAGPRSTCTKSIATIEKLLGVLEPELRPFDRRERPDRDTLQAVN
jgi:hypothetical protein